MLAISQQKYLKFTFRNNLLDNELFFSLNLIVVRKLYANLWRFKQLEPFFRTSKQGRPVKDFNEKFADAAVVFVEKEKKILGAKQDYKEFFIFLNSLKGLFRNSINLIDNFLEENKEFFN